MAKSSSFAVGQRVRVVNAAKLMRTDGQYYTHGDIGTVRQHIVGNSLAVEFDGDSWGGEIDPDFVWRDWRYADALSCIQAKKEGR